MSAPEDSTTVRYTAKELFARIDQKLDVIANQLTAKADHEALVAAEVRMSGLVGALAERVATLEDVRVAALETELAERKGFNKAKAAIIGLGIAVVGLFVPLISQFFFH
jgi:hypothetical protein